VYRCVYRWARASWGGGAPRPAFRNLQAFLCYNPSFQLLTRPICGQVRGTDGCRLLHPQLPAPRWRWRGSPAVGAAGPAAGISQLLPAAHQGTTLPA
jgi:hypothetical protein